MYRKLPPSGGGAVGNSVTGGSEGGGKLAPDPGNALSEKIAHSTVYLHLSDC